LKYTYPGKEIHLELEVYAFWVNGDLRMKHYVLQIIIQYYQDVAVKLKGYEGRIAVFFSSQLASLVRKLALFAGQGVCPP